MSNFLRKLSIKYRLMAAFSVLFILSTALAAGVIYSTVRETVQDNILAELRASTDGIRNTVQIAAHVSIRNRLRAIAEKNVDILAALDAEAKAGRMTEAGAREEAKRI